MDQGFDGMKLLADSASWQHYLERTLQCYGESLLRRIAGKLLKPRSQWSAPVLIQRCVDGLGNAALVDRRLEAQELAGRHLLAVMSHGRQTHCKLGSLLEILAALGHAEGPGPALSLCEAGLLFPVLIPETGTEPSAAAPLTKKLDSFEHWLTRDSGCYKVFTTPIVLSRALEADLGIPSCVPVESAGGATHQADGLEWPLRLATVWQQLQQGPLRRTQQGDFFKRDLDRLQSDPILNASPADTLADLPDLALFSVALAQSMGIAVAADGEVCAGDLPSDWEGGLPLTIASLWSGLLRLEGWNPQSGWSGPEAAGSPFPSAYLLSFLFLAKQPAEAWVDPADVETWVLKHHPFWQQDALRPSQQRRWVAQFLLGLAYQFGLLQAVRDRTGQWAVRLSPLARWLMSVVRDPVLPNSFQKTLLVQPNLEIVVYRQGASPDLIGKLSRFAVWKSLGAACTLRLQSEQIYRALEAGLGFDAILQLLERHGMKPVPPTVIESLRTWADKRERIAVYPSATLFEFASQSDLDEALARGLPGIRLSDRLAAVPSEAGVDFSNFRLTGTRDYGLPPEKCVEVEEDGVTLIVDQARSDLLLDSEILRFAEAQEEAGVAQKRRYRMTPQSLAIARHNGFDAADLEAWFARRVGEVPSPAALLLMTANGFPPAHLKTLQVLRVASEVLADGLMQWPHTRDLIKERLGPVSLAIEAEDVHALRQRLDWLGLKLEIAAFSIADKCVEQVIESRSS
jgi:hypothetical protein